jgi:hypothetical protein
MLRYDEYVCRSLTFPPNYELPDDTAGKQVRKLLEGLACGQVKSYYDNGLQVPRSLFHSRLAVLLLAAEARTRRMVITPYFFCSGRELMLSKAELGHLQHWPDDDTHRARTLKNGGPERPPRKSE